MQSLPLISIIIPALNEEKYIAECLDSILEANYPNEKMEIFVIDGMSHDNTKTIVEAYSQKYSSIHLLINSESYTPIGMNMGIKISSGKYIFILSAHAEYSSNYFIRLVENIEKLNADCVGGILHTEMKNINKRSSSIKEVLMHRFGVGNATFRTGSDILKEVDTVAYGCYRRETFEKYGLFNESLIRNQDIELNKRIVKSGGKIYLIPDIASTYYGREDFKSLALNNYQNGFWNILTTYYTGSFSSLSFRHFVPLFFILSILLPLLFSVMKPQVLWIVFFSLLSYLSLVIIMSFRLKNCTNSIPYLIISFLTLHFSYGWGSFVGVLNVIGKYLKGEK